ncbi:MAG: response regulator, partial [Synergistota bacterium]|nr:response regulator [Synergistota bacterium]
MKELILLAEDDTAIQTGVRDLLESEGYRVTTADDGRSALDLYHKLKPDLVLLDVMMPGMNGYDVCREIRLQDRHTPVLMLTAKGREVDKVVGLELGADD